MIDFLLEERAQGRSIDDHISNLRLLRQQVERMGAVISRYQRLARTDADRRPLALNDVVRSAVDHLGTRWADCVSLQFGSPLPKILGDWDLLHSAIDNVLRNALEADGQNKVFVRTGCEAESENVWVEVEDTGQGIDARTLARVWDDFFTTKTDGSGLGLGFVQRIAQAHDGRAAIDSVLGAGTVVRIYIPVARNEDEPI